MLTHRLTDDAEMRALEPWLAAEFAAYVERHRAYLDEWLPFVRLVTDTDSAHRYLTAYAERQARDDGRIYGIWSADELVGGTIFRTFDADRRTCELGVWLAPEATGRGLVTAACAAMIEWAFRVRGMARVEWRADPANTRSLAVARRLGMTREGVLRSASRHADRQIDVEVWAVLAAEQGTEQETGWDARHI